MIFVGDDSAEDHHDVYVMDAEGARLASRRLPEGLSGIRGLHELTQVLQRRWSLAECHWSLPAPITLENPNGAGNAASDRVGVGGITIAH
jgi:hypothetical protein